MELKKYSLRMIWVMLELVLIVFSLAPAVSSQQQKQIKSYLVLPPLDETVDVVIIITAADRKLKFLEAWKKVISNLHIFLILEDGVSPEKVLVPEWADYEMYSYDDIKRALGPDCDKVIKPKGPSLRNFAILVSDRDYIFFLDGSIVPSEVVRGEPLIALHQTGAKKPVASRVTIVGHLLYNLMQGAEFGAHLADHANSTSSYIRYNINPDKRLQRTGISSTCLTQNRRSSTVSDSHGGSSNDNAFIMRACGRSDVASSTLPLGSHFNFLAEKCFLIDRLLMAHVMFFIPFEPDEHGDYYTRSEVFTSVMLKFIFDHVSVGIKVDPAAPRVARIQSKAAAKSAGGGGGLRGTSNWANDSLITRPEVVNFFKTTMLNELHGTLTGRWDVPWRTCPGHYHALKYEDYNRHLECFFIQLARRFKKELGTVDKAFENVELAMMTWTKIWMLRHMDGLATYGQEPIMPRASRCYLGPRAPDSQCAVMTMVRNENIMLPWWLRYYTRHVNPRDIYILDHYTDDNSTDPSLLPAGVNVIRLKSNPNVMPIFYRGSVVRDYQDRFIRCGYKCTIFTDTDELILPDPGVYPGGLRQYLDKFINDTKTQTLRTTAWEIAHIHYGNGTPASVEPAYNWSDPYIFRQRSFFNTDPRYNKPILTKIPHAYRPGFHHLIDKTIGVGRDENLILLHMTSFDYGFCNWKAELHYNLSKLMTKEDSAGGYATHWERYHHFKSKGMICQFADGVFKGPLTEKTRVTDSTGSIPLVRIPPSFRDALV